MTFLKLYQPIKATLSDSLIPFEWIEKHATCYQVLLQQISDYLLCDIKCWQETDDDVVFVDINRPKLDVKLHHFRSSSAAGVCKYIQDCWELCLKNCHSLIPAYKIKVYQKSAEKYETVKLQTLSHFEPYLAEYDHETITTKDSKKNTSNNTMSLISLNNEHLSSSLNNTNSKTSDFSITESSIDAVTVSSIEVSHNMDNSISPVFAQKLLIPHPRQT